MEDNWIDKLCSSRKQEAIKNVLDDPERVVELINTLLVENMKLSERIVGLNELVDVLLIGKGMTAEQLKEAFPNSCAERH